MGGNWRDGYDDEYLGDVEGPLITPEQVDFSSAVLASVRTLRIMLPVPARPGGGNPAFDGTTGEPIMDKQGVQKRGFVFRNGKDHVWQVAKEDGTGVIIVNDVDETKAPRLMAAYHEAVSCLSTRTKALRFTLGEFSRMGYDDQFNSTLSGVAETLQKKEGQSYDTDGAGLYLREGKLVEVVRIVGTGFFQGPVDHAFSKSAVLVRHGPGKVNLCQPKVFENTYVMEDGTPAKVDDLPVGFDMTPAPSMRI